MIRSALVLALALASCSSPRVCTSGEVRMCAGLSGCVGARVCNASGDAFGECVCGGTGGGTATGGGSNGGGSNGGGSNGGGSSGSGGGTVIDAGRPDAGCPLTCGSACCRYGELCGSVDGGLRCFSDEDPGLRPYCDNCTGTAGAICGTGSNFCFEDMTCGADCSRGQACPAGYACSDVLVTLTQFACTRSNPACPANPSLPCGTTPDCPRGQCNGGQCAGFCELADGDPIGSCSCQVDADCSQDICSGGECSISRGACVVIGDCRTIRCVGVSVDGGSRGRCLVGQNCRPAPGLTCAEVG